MTPTTDTVLAPASDTADLLSILRQNLGFEDPEGWLEYARRHSFRRVDATPVTRCPGCRTPPAHFIGQFIYYSTLLRLVDCRACGLIWANVHLDPAVIANHFEHAYKSRQYFLYSRAVIFEALASLACAAAPRFGRVLDIGGAQGDLVRRILDRRPDLEGLVHDLSEESLRFARQELALSTVHGDLVALEELAQEHDVVILSDVLYYEPRLGEFWALLPRLVSAGGTVLIRIPNKLPLIRLYQWARDLLTRLVPSRRQDKVRFFNPEHIYILSPRYLRTRLTQAGFTRITMLPTPPLVCTDARWRRVLAWMSYVAARVVASATLGHVILSASMVVRAIRIR